MMFTLFLVAFFLSAINCGIDHHYGLYWKNFNQKVLVYDNIFTNDSTDLLKFRHIVTTTNGMQFNGNVDHNQQFQSLSGFQLKLNNKQRSLFENLLVKKLTKVVKQKFQHKAENLLLENVNMHIVESADFNPVFKFCEINEPAFFVVVILSSGFMRNDYGDLALYNEKNDIVKSLHPKFGRTIFLECGYSLKINPPAIATSKRGYFAFIKFGLEAKEPVTLYDPVLLSNYLENVEADKENVDYEVLDVSLYVTRKIIFGKSKKKIYVLDNIFPEKLLGDLYNYLINESMYYEEIEEEEEDSEDNVKWILDLSDPNFNNGVIWKILKQVNQYISNNKTYMPYDITCNHVRRTDTTTIHVDCPPDETELTNLIYLNPNWEVNKYGETIFMDGNEFLAAVIPKFGRLVVFDGNIDHSARPPSPNLNGARYTLAVKTSTDPESARRRMEPRN